jgi:hypothetical protein
MAGVAFFGARSGGGAQKKEGREVTIGRSHNVFFAVQSLAELAAEGLDRRGNATRAWPQALNLLP